MDATWRAIANEAALAAEHIGLGVTALGRANYAERAYYPEAFFALSVGLERSAKLAIIVDYAIDHGGIFPDENAYRKYDHNLERLMTAMAEIAQRRGGGEEARQPNSEIHQTMLEVLSDFASNVTRYYNLDVLAGTSAPEDPVAAWDRRVTQAVLAAHDTERSRKRREENARQVGQMMSGISLVRHESESGVPLTSAASASLRTGELEFARSWERMYLLQFGRFAYLTMDALSHSGHAVLGGRLPYREFFAIYYNEDKYLRGRATWSIYKP